MTNVPTTFGFPDTLPPCASVTSGFTSGTGSWESCSWRPAFPRLVPSPGRGLLLLACWAALHARALSTRFAREHRRDARYGYDLGSM